MEEEKRTWSSVYYMRSADEDREISPQQLRNLMLSVSDSIVNIESNNQELTFEQLKMLYAGNNFTLRENTFKQNLNLLTREGTYNLVAAILADVNSCSKIVRPPGKLYVTVRLYQESNADPKQYANSSNCILQLRK